MLLIRGVKSSRGSRGFAGSEVGVHSLLDLCIHSVNLAVHLCMALSGGLGESFG